MKALEKLKQLVISLVQEGFSPKEALEIAYYQVKIEEKEI